VQFCALLFFVGVAVGCWILLLGGWLSSVTFLLFWVSILWLACFGANAVAGLCFLVSCCVFVLGIGPLLSGLLPWACCILCGCSLLCAFVAVGCTIFDPCCGCVVIVMFSVCSHEGAAWG